MLKLWGGFLFCWLVSSCATMSYISSGEIPVNINLKKGHSRKLITTGTKNYYLWGLYPKEQFVYMDREFQEVGAQAISGLTIKEEQDFVDSLLSVLSLGVYIPRSYEIRGYAP